MPFILIPYVKNTLVVMCQVLDLGTNDRILTFLVAGAIFLLLPKCRLTKWRSTNLFSYFQTHRPSDSSANPEGQKLFHNRINQNNETKQLKRSIHFRFGRRFPKIFLLREKSRNNLTWSQVVAAVHSIATKIANQKVQRQAAQLPLNHHAPDLHTVAPGLWNCSFPTVALQATVHHQLWIEYSLIRLSLLWTLAWDPPNQKK